MLDRIIVMILVLSFLVYFLSVYLTSKNDPNLYISSYIGIIACIIVIILILIKMFLDCLSNKK
jgi:ABC-type Na+ efflux pump permease subunit